MTEETGEAEMTLVLDSAVGRSDEEPMTGSGGGRKRRGGEPADERVTTLAQFSSAYRQLLAATTPMTVAQAAVEAARWALGCDISWCGFLQGDTLVMGAYSGFRNPEIADVWSLGLGQGIGGRVAAEGRTITIRDYLRDPRRVPVMKKVIDDEGIRGCICAPLVSDPLLPAGSILGVLYVAVRRPNTFSRQECDLLTALARDTGVKLGGVYREAALHQERDEVRERNDLLEQRLRILGDLADTYADTGDLASGLRVLAAHVGGGVAVVDQSGTVLGKANDVIGDEKASVPLQAGSVQLGRMEVSRERPFSPGDLELLDYSRRVVTLELLRERSTLDAELRLHGELIDDLLHGNLPDEAAIVRRAALLGLDLRQPAVVACFGIHVGHPGGADDVPPPIARSIADLIERLARRRFDQVIVAVRPSEVVAVLGTGDRNHATVHSALSELVTTATSLLGGKPLAAGVGRRCVSLADYADSFSEASTALELARSRPDPGQVLTPADLGLLAVLGRGQQKKPLRDLVTHALEPLVAADRQSGSEYLKTLHTYLSADRHLERAACELHVHVNTLRYRLGKIQELLGVDLHDVDARFVLELALRVHAILD
jgi:sugar diacid utilization regulator/putative methionine-R-sulfoxide reductase with GAF domain